MLTLKKRTEEYPAAAPCEFYLARQPIFDRDRQVIGYELLYRAGATARAGFVDGNQATATLITNSFLEMGLERITGGRLAFINLTHAYLAGDIMLPLEKDKVVLEVLEDAEIDARCLAGIQSLHRQGWCIALDDFVLQEGNRALLPYASIAKIDVLALGREAAAEQVRELSRYPLKLLAEKIETEEVFAWCEELGFHYFQGYFFAKPKLISGRQLPPSQVALLRILAKLQAPECDIEEIEELISHDLGVSYKLLKIINSSYYGIGFKVNSIQHALVVLGLNTLKKWLMIMSLSMVGDKPRELVDLSLIRARMCERLAARFACRPDEAFTVGLFSLLDVLMDQSREELLAALPLSNAIVEALIAGRGGLGRLLQAVIAFERGEWEMLADDEGDSAAAAYRDALNWTWEINTQLGR